MVDCGAQGPRTFFCGCFTSAPCGVHVIGDRLVVLGLALSLVVYVERRRERVFGFFFGVCSWDFGPVAKGFIFYPAVDQTVSRIIAVGYGCAGPSCTFFG